MISYKYKLYKSNKLIALDYMMAEAAFVWNHALALQKRYYSLSKTFGWDKKYISLYEMEHHFAKRIKRTRLASHTVREMLKRQDIAFNRFFKKIAKRPPKFKKAVALTSFVFDYSGYKLYGDEFIINKISKRFKFSLSRRWEGRVKLVRVVRSNNDWYIVIVTDASPKQYGKTHTGASVGVDFGLKTFMTFSDGTRIEAPLFYKQLSNKIVKWQRLLSKSSLGSNHRKAYKRQLNRVYADLNNKRRDWYYKTAHRLCQQYEFIFIEDLNISGMMTHKNWGRKVSDLGWSTFVGILESISTKYGVTLHKVGRYFASSRLCDCGYKNDALRLSDREWVCPNCGQVHDRDLHAAQNIYRQGVADLRSIGKTLQSVAYAGSMR